VNDLATMSAAKIAVGVRNGTFRAEAVLGAALAQIHALDGMLNCFTTVTVETAIADARRVDTAVQAGRDPGPLAGVPFAAKNMFDIAGIVTIAGSRIHRDHPPAWRDATLVARLREAGGVLVGALNMDEYAYGFTTENAHDGATRNPHDPERSAGGSSGGSAAAVAAGMVPISLGSDTNGSIRVPAALCGVFGLKPTYGRLSRAGAVPFVGSLDHFGPFARSAADLALAYDALQGRDELDPVQANVPAAPASPGLDAPIDGLRVGVLAGWFRAGATDQALAALDAVATALGATGRVELPEAERARAAAFCITAAEGGALHLPDLRTRAGDFDPATRSRFLAGALLPAAPLIAAQRFRRWFRDEVRRLFARFDILLAPATPCPAPLIGQATMMLGGVEVPVRPNLGLYTQPLSFIGLPVVAVPIRRLGELPVGVQLIGPAWEEARLLRIAAFLERAGVVAAPVA